MTNPASIPRPIKVLCPVCETRALQVTHLPEQNRYLLRCWNCPDGTTGEWLKLAAKALDTFPDKLLRDPLSVIGLHPAGHPAFARTGSGAPGRLGAHGKAPSPMLLGAGSEEGTGPDGQGSTWGRFPSSHDIARMNGSLLRERSALEVRLWLRNERLIRRKVLKAAQIGWWSSRGVLVFPLFSPDGRLVNVRVRRPGPGNKMRSWPADLRPAGPKNEAFPLFPLPSTPESTIVVCAGELDALALLSAGVNAVSVTSGVGSWFESYTEQLRNRRVWIAFDKGEERAAEHVSGLLPHSRIHRWSADKPKGFDVTDCLKMTPNYTKGS